MDTFSIKFRYKRSDEEHTLSEIPIDRLEGAKLIKKRLLEDAGSLCINGQCAICPLHTRLYPRKKDYSCYAIMSDDVVKKSLKIIK